MENKHLILGVHIHNRGETAMHAQRLLSEYGCNIKTRLGLHEVSGDYCAAAGVLLLEMVGDEARCLALADQLDLLDGVEVQKMMFGHQTVHS